MLTVIAKLRARPGQGTALAGQMNQAAAEVRNEPGNYAYVVHRASDDPDLVMIYEQYEDRAALDAHRDHLKEMGLDLSALLAGRPELEFFEPVD